MVDWLHPRQLAATGIKAALGALFGAYADKREVQAALQPVQGGSSPFDADYSAEGPGDTGFWFDYTADTGDGFDATYSLAWLLSRSELPVAGLPRSLPRGRLLVLGGDQVYPTATREEYQDRFLGPFRAAFPWGPEPSSPHLYAIPGNHDWYDGLTSFTRLFCQRRWVGGWKCHQRRSYFAIKLPYGWHLWGIDIQLEADIDQPQMDFFRRVAARIAEEARAAQRPPRLILCTAEPQWVYCREESRRGLRLIRGCELARDPQRFTPLDFFHREIIARHGLELVVVLSGDLHHYTRYTARPREGESTLSAIPQHLITCGGGGAYLYPTHHMPARVELPWSRRTELGEVVTEPVTYQRRGTYPTARDSRSLGRWSWLGLPFRNRSFATLLGCVYLLFSWILQSASKAGNDLFADWWPQRAIELGIGAPKVIPPSIAELVARVTLPEGEPTPFNLDLAFGTVIRAFWDVMRHSPAAVVLVLSVLFGLWSFRRSAGPPGVHGLAGLAHGALHLLLAFTLVWWFSWLNLSGGSSLPPLFLRLLGSWHIDHPLQVLLFSTEMLVFGGLLGGWLFGLYLMSTSRLSGAHINEVFSSRHLTAYKSLLRFHLTTGGGLTVYSIGVPAVPQGREWRFRPAEAPPRPVGPGEPWFAPPGDRILTELIEDEPVVLAAPDQDPEASPTV
jgi:hypothetical protein